MRIYSNFDPCLVQYIIRFIPEREDYTPATGLSTQKRGIFFYLIMNVPCKLINSIVRNRGRKELSALLHIKSLYKNGCIYNYTVSKLSRKLHYSETKIRALINTFLDNGWCRLHGFNLIFKSFKTIYKETYNYAPVHMANITDAISIDCYIVTNYLRRQQYAINRVLDRKSPAKRKAYNKACKNSKGEKEHVYRGTSLKCLAKVFSLSISSVCQIIKKLKEANFINVIPQFRTMYVKTANAINTEFEVGKGLFLRHGATIRRSPSILLITPTNPFKNPNCN